MLNHLDATARQIGSRWLTADGSVASRQWAETRLLFALFLLASSGVPRAGNTALLPSPLVKTDGRLGADWMLAHLSSEQFDLLSVLTILLILAFGLGWRPRATGLATGVLLFAGSTVLYSTAGKVVHMQWVPLAVLVLAWFGWGNRIRALSPRLILAWIISWGMFMSGAAKIIGRWADPSFSVVELRVLGFIAVEEDTGTLASRIAPVLRTPVVGEVLDLATIVLEVGIVLLIAHPLWFRRGILVLAVFHLAIWQTLGISFAGILPAYVVFFAEDLRGVTKFHLGALIAVAIGAAMSVFDGVADTAHWLLRPLGGPQLLNQGLLLVVVALLATPLVTRSVGRNSSGARVLPSRNRHPRLPGRRS